LLLLIFGRPFVKRLALCYRSVVCPVCLSCPVLSVTFVHCGQTVGRNKMQLGMQVGLGPGHIMLDGTQLPLRQMGRAPQFSAHVYCGKRSMDLDGAWHGGRPWRRAVSDGHPKRGSPQFSARPLWPNGHNVLNGDSVPLQKRVHSSPSFLARVCCGQMARWSKKPLGMK